MATLIQEQTAKETLHRTLEELAKIKADDLVRSEDLGKDLNFLSGVPIFSRVLNLFHILSESNLDNVPYSVLTALQAHAAEALTKFKAVQTFSAKQNNPTGIRDSLISDLQERYDSYFIAVSPTIAYSVRKGTDFEALEKTARHIVASLEGSRLDFDEKQKGAIVTMESTLEKVRRAAAEVGVAQHATHFKDESASHASDAHRWLIAAVIASLLTLVWGFVCFWIDAPGNPPTTASLIQFIFAKVIILSVLYSALVWSASNYSAHRHNNVVNKHRQNALSTFETFVKAAEDDNETKHAVLLQATDCIFSPQASGYLEGEIAKESPNKLIEIMRTVSSATKTPQ